ncbi:glycerol kinase GlpK [Thermoclostridium stercorarium subsp. stercorarium DSM 8532]|uniref:Glycerol kinase n=3 Tax=Thermoclostridium stercorarium TaxID=1510 RepID=L7VSV8_THES1|nr:glycerol kinase GlpK [Thermoclostridium stercorarium]AGC69669.1 glycerol kinase GlpK [Thermoclostridium stercorarium subsp. stercorarium DSM 8532]AGI40621.1 glycerol kinase [Thermoclostridium stercorarium subsp. stercorarium DSM 8532]ANW99891.1 glycerol kinase [Thermoclostridium stercorarium subsp. thermolacticum DSM 2910]ANX02515.1 glycerol kinase [Thermoclostridium stercorarium subsp. leptospartum DSM 9219]UZQ85607.1 glycerol kinase GlpK [Thermoclostridium stercorarium]
MGKYVITLDQGTTSSRAIVFDGSGSITGMVKKEHRQIYPKPGWVEHDPEEILENQIEVLRSVVEKCNISVNDILAVGITNQRETVVLWDKNTGKPVHNAIVWQCRRSAGICDKLIKDGLEDEVHKKTGLIIDAYFSGTKLKWIFDNFPDIRKEAEKGNVYAGTIDTWLVWNLTGKRVHATDYSNASRTMLFNILSLKWDEEILKILNIPVSILPEVRPSASLFGYIDKKILGKEIPVAAVLGDQQASLFGQTCFEPGMAKNTYGTGCFLLVNTGNRAVFSKNRLLTTIAWGIDDRVDYALEGSVFIAGSAIQWLRDGLKIISTSRQCDELAEEVEDTKGVYFVPAFTGLGTPYWDMYARGAIFGLTGGVTREHIARATLEAIAYQVKDLVECMKEDSDSGLSLLKVDGGASVSDIMMQFQADILRTNVVRPKVVETTALGAAFMAGLKTGMWSGLEEISKIWAVDRVFEPQMDEERSKKLYAGWKKAVERSRGWAEN